MAVLSSALWRVQAGRTTEFLEAVEESKKIHERLGARAFLMQWSNAGTNSGTFSYGLLHADIGHWGQFADDVAKDSDWRALTAKTLDVPNPAAALVSQSLATDQRGFDAPDPAAPGTFVLGATAQLAPGRQAADAHRLMADIKPALLDCGAAWVRFRRVGIGGESTLNFVLTLGFATAAAYGAWQMKFNSDPRGQAFLQAAFGPGSVLVGVTQATGRVLRV